MSATVDGVDGSPPSPSPPLPPAGNSWKNIPTDSNMPRREQKRKKRHGGFFHLYAEDEEKFGQEYILVHNKNGEIKLASF